MSSLCREGFSKKRFRNALVWRRFIMMSREGLGRLWEGGTVCG